VKLRRLFVLGRALPLVALVVLLAWALVPDRSAPASGLVRSSDHDSAFAVSLISNSQSAGGNSGGNGNCNGSNSGNTANCHGLDNSLDGQPVVTGSGLKPGGSLTGQVTLTVTGPKSNVVLTEPSISNQTCTQNNLHCPTGLGNGNLAGYLRMTITDLTTSRIVYSGAFGSLPSTTVCGKSAGSCSQWDNKETHTLRVDVAFPNGPGTVSNAYQGTSASAQLTWTRV